jgi:hypothetical protein
LCEGRGEILTMAVRSMMLLLHSCWAICEQGMMDLLCCAIIASDALFRGSWAALPQETCESSPESQLASLAQTLPPSCVQPHAQKVPRSPALYDLHAPLREKQSTMSFFRNCETVTFTSLLEPEGIPEHHLIR